MAGQGEQNGRGEARDGRPELMRAADDRIAALAE
jgi:hypothetical protein